jgi:hypothetical protein
MKAIKKLRLKILLKSELKKQAKIIEKFKSEVSVITKTTIAEIEKIDSCKYAFELQNIKHVTEEKEKLINKIFSDKNIPISEQVKIAITKNKELRDFVISVRKKINLEEEDSYEKP